MRNVLYLMLGIGLVIVSMPSCTSMDSGSKEVSPVRSEPPMETVFHANPKVSSPSSKPAMLRSVGRISAPKHKTVYQERLLFDRNTPVPKRYYRVGSANEE